MPKTKILIRAVIISSLFGYFSWGNGMDIFLFQLEFEILARFFSNPMLILDPIIILPVVGQFLLIVTLFHKQPNITMILTGIFVIAIMFIFMLIYGLIGQSYKMAISTVPFWISSFLLLRHLRRLKNK